MIVPISLICIYSKEIILFLFGDAWVEAHIYVIALAPFFILNSCNTSFSSIFVVKNKIFKMLKLETIYLTAKIVVIFIFFYLGFDVKYMINTLGVLLFITSIITAIFFYNISNYSVDEN